VIEFTGERVVPGEVNADLWAEHFARYAFASRFAGGKRVLDLGCGTGYGTAELSNRARMVVGIDNSADAIAYARAHYAPPNTRWLQAHAAALPVAASFDLITAFEVIEHLSDWPALLTEARRVLAPDGLFLVSTPNKLYYAETRTETGPNPFHAHEFTYAEFSEAIRAVFPNAIILLQNQMEAVAFYSPQLAIHTNEARLDSTRGGPDQAAFFLAACPAADLPPLSNFFYVPRATNLLREREEHVRMLENDRDQLKLNLASLQASHDELNRHLESHNRWALELEQNWKAAADRVVELQGILQREQAEWTRIATAYQEKIKELERENREKTQWALDTEQRLSTELAAKCAELAEAVRLLDQAEATVTERTEWARSLDRTLTEVAQSRWVRFGRSFGLGPQVDK
jgi:ubiquinone/menaquinone biosynthesis C-methylase UbiE